MQISKFYDIIEAIKSLSILGVFMHQIIFIAGLSVIGKSTLAKNKIFGKTKNILKDLIKE